MSYWKQWHPIIIDNTTSTLLDIKGEMTGDENVDFLVFLFENPKSPFALSGATSLFSHDCLHILLRRGLLPQDEGFVIGFSMGTDDSTKWWHLLAFKALAKFFYPKYYKLSDKDLAAFNLGVQYARELKSRGYKNLHAYPFKENQNKTIKDISSAMGITLEDLNRYRSKEKELIPNSASSKRLFLLSEQSLSEDLKEREDKAELKKKKK